MSENGTKSIEEYLEMKSGLSKYFEEATEFSQENLEKFQILLKEFKESWESSTTKKGKSLETLVTFIFEHIDIFEVVTNLRTSTNEIDQIITLSDLGNALASDKLFDIKGIKLLLECKNYDAKVDVTWVGKFCNLLMDHQPIRVGIIFSRYGFTGKSPWTDAQGLAKKFYYRKEDYDRKMYVIDFNLKDLERMSDGVSFIKILRSKIEALELDTNYENFLTYHPAQKIEEKLST